MNKLLSWLKCNGFTKLHTKVTTYSKMIPLGHIFLVFTESGKMNLTITLTMGKTTHKETYPIQADEMEYEDFIEEFPQMARDFASEIYGRFLSFVEPQ